jgi:hypothetical protein
MATIKIQLLAHAWGTYMLGQPQGSAKGSPTIAGIEKKASVQLTHSASIQVTGVILYLGDHPPPPPLPLNFQEILVDKRCHSNNKTKYVLEAAVLVNFLTSRH